MCESWKEETSEDGEFDGVEWCGVVWIQGWIEMME